MSTPTNQFEGFDEQGALDARKTFVETASSILEKSGSELGAYGFALGARGALAIAVQISAEVAKGILTMLGGKNWYAAAALLRQFVEIEYLLSVFVEDPNEAERWLAATEEELRYQFSPKQLRKRAAGSFRDEDYWSHCSIGGHPNPRAKFLLPRRMDNRDSLYEAILYFEFAHHAAGILSSLLILRQAYFLEDVRRLERALEPAAAAHQTWIKGDIWAANLSRAPHLD